MKEDGVAPTDTTEKAIENFRYRQGRRCKSRCYSARLVQTTHTFMDHPPAPLYEEPFPTSIVRAGVFRVMFYNCALMEFGLAKVRAHARARMIVDSTYKTNSQNHVVVCAGLGFHCGSGGRLHNRFLPMCGAAQGCIGSHSGR